MCLAIVCVDEHGRTRAHAFVCVHTAHVSQPRYSPGLYVRVYIGLMRAYVYVYTRPSPCYEYLGQCLPREWLFEPRFGVPTSIFLDFVNVPLFCFFAAKVSPRWLPHSMAFPFVGTLWFFCPLLFPFSSCCILFSFSFFLFFSAVICFPLPICVLSRPICLENTWPQEKRGIFEKRSDFEKEDLFRGICATGGKYWALSME